MKNIQFVLFALFFAITACQGDPVTQVKKSADAAPKVVNTSSSKSEASSTQEMENSKVDKPKLIEFYVEEDKKKRSSSKKESSTNKPARTDKTASTDSKPTEKKSTSGKKVAKMKFVNDTHAFGIIKPGDVIEHKFEFTNTGTKDLVITDAKATCGCTQPSFPFIPIPPGEKGFIGVKYDSTGKLGSQKPTVTITTNGSPKTRKVYLEGVVISKMSN